MDSLTQIALGSCVGAVIGGCKYGRKAALMGAIIGTVPDLDVFFPLGDPVSDFTYHRGVSHSFLFCIFGAPIFAWLFSSLKWFGAAFKDKALHLIVFFGLLTHVLLDAMTVYGTQLLWPLATPPVGVGSMFIIDPLYTVPLLFGLAWFLVNHAVRPAFVALVVSTLYLGWSVGAQAHVTTVAKDALNRPYIQVLATPTPFNTLLWRVVVVEDDGYAVGYYSVFDKDKKIVFQKFETDKTLLDPVVTTFPVMRLQWFTKGFYAVRGEGHNIIMSDLRMGLEPDQYAFQFVVGKNGAGYAVPLNERYRVPRNMERLNRIWPRIWDEEQRFVVP